MAAAHDVQALLARIGSPSKLRLARGPFQGPPEAAIDDLARRLVLSWPGLDEVLPDGGLPRGVVELTAPRALGGSTSLALAAVRAGQARAREAWCAWIDPEMTLYAPGVVAAGVDLTRMLLVCPPRAEIARTALKVVGSGAFEVVVVDVHSSLVRGERKIDPVRDERPVLSSSSPPDSKMAMVVRRLTLAAEPSGATVLLLTDSTRPRAVQWPVALRLELGRPSRTELSVRVAKERRGRLGVAKTIPFRPLMRVTG